MVNIPGIMHDHAIHCCVYIVMIMLVRSTIKAYSEGGYQHGWVGRFALTPNPFCADTTVSVNRCFAQGQFWKQYGAKCHEMSCSFGRRHKPHNTLFYTQSFQQSSRRGMNDLNLIHVFC